jgi:hypothetical protein
MAIGSFMSSAALLTVIPSWSISWATALGWSRKQSISDCTSNGGNTTTANTGHTGQPTKEASPSMAYAGSARVLERVNGTSCAQTQNSICEQRQAIRLRQAGGKF